MDVGIDSAEIMQEIVDHIYFSAMEDPENAPLYAELCDRMKEEVSSFDDPQSEKPITFKRLLLDKCQKGFETRDIEEFDEMTSAEKEVALERFKKKMIGNVVFIGELFKVGLLTANIMHECMRQLLTYDDVPDQNDLACLFHLMITIGKVIDTDDNSKNMSMYCARINSIGKDKRLPAHIRTMMIALIDIRKNKWETQPWSEDRHYWFPKKVKEAIFQILLMWHRDQLDEGVEFRWNELPSEVLRIIIVHLARRGSNE
eukprot:TRINITY_DN803_c0_g2_i1.p1 TRINITY_DN803_c0_g2~~TRINITY_DN803_c0_g2_i1.p1  ORF type:complete len:258 (-),score=62.77 TRINITY_DN803_c0_g2_i1:26-799(-)